jgi:hypothetical protein
MSELLGLRYLYIQFSVMCGLFLPKIHKNRNMLTHFFKFKNVIMCTLRYGGRRKFIF